MKNTLLNDSAPGAKIVSPYFTSKEAAEFLDVSSTTLNKLVKKKLFYKLTLPNGQVRYRKDEVEAAKDKIGEVEQVTLSSILANNPDLMTIADAAQYLKVSVATIKSLIKKEKLVKYPIGRWNFVNIEEVEEAYTIQEIPDVDVNEPEPDPTIYITFDEAASKLGFPMPKLHGYINENIFTRCTVGKWVRLLRSEVEAEVTKEKIKNNLGRGNNE